MSTSLSLPAITATSACPSVYSALSAQIPIPTVFSSQFAAASTDPCATVGLETVNPEAFMSWAADTEAIMSRHQEYVGSAALVCSEFLVSTIQAQLARSTSCLATRTGTSNGTAISTSRTTTTSAPGSTGQPGTTTTSSSATTSTSQPASTTTGARGSAGWSVRSSVGLLAGAVFAVGMLNM
ncbi:hypothetical protein RB595_005994 [Gaeumannomyces hyphopodioides]